MTDQRPEHEVRVALHSVADQLPGAHVDVQRIKVRAKRRRRQLYSAALGTAVVLASGVAVLLTLQPQDNSRAQLAVPNRATLCPQTMDGWKRGPARPGIEKVLVPADPEVVTICRYDTVARQTGDVGGSRNELRLSRFGDLSRGPLAELVSALNAAPLTNEKCQESPSAVVLAHFRYSAGADVEVVINMENCWNATNGARSTDVRGITIPGFIDSTS
ncbi:hypothetical protein [Amycolatopsis sp.]|uniref:hypothetical protein n=1 Tax=Amycolatopsis sp. TaxID=37632 RepID=UPI002C2CD4A0|nr:hypothetical protein [Amycolatopsis sp.]HVV12023.1 hypothetical protein [Amycolatopsis sp.]